MFEAFFRPLKIAVIGGLKHPSDVGNRLTDNLRAGGFRGEIAVQDPNENLDLKKREVDLALIAVNADEVLPAVRRAVDNQVNAVIVFAYDVSSEDKKNVAKMCKDHGIFLLGPESAGIIDTHNSLNASIMGSMPKRGSIALFSQSKALAAAMVDRAESLGMGLSKAISIGKGSDVSVGDILTELADDEQTEVIAGHLESIPDGDSFIRAAEASVSKKPIVILKGGIAPHNGNRSDVISREDIAYGAAFKRAGVLRAKTFEELFDFTSALKALPLTTGNRIGVVSNSRSAGILTFDVLTNPMALKIERSFSRFGSALKELIKSPKIDALIALLIPIDGVISEDVASIIAELAFQSQKPLVAVTMGGKSADEVSRRITNSGALCYPSPYRAARALEACFERSAWSGRPPRIVTRYPVNRRRTERILSRCIRTGQYEVPEIAAKEILRIYGFKVPFGQLAASAEEAVEKALEIGFPVNLKLTVQNVQIGYSLDRTRQNLTTQDQVRDAFDLMVLRARNKFEEIRLEGVYIEKSHRGVLDVIMGMRRDPQFGPMLLFGLGGLSLEVMEDIAFHLAPISADEAMQMLTRTHSYAKLEEYVHTRGIDLEPIVAGLQRISQVSTDFPVVQELEINPFLVNEAGDESLAADVRITLRHEGGLK